MNSLDIYMKDAYISYMEACADIDMIYDMSCIQMYTEEGSDESIFQRLKGKVKSLVDKISTKIKNFLGTNDLKKKVSEAEAMDQRILNDAKIEIIDSTKKNVFTKKYIDKIKNAKSVDEINKIMDDYNKKKKVTKFTVVISGAALLVIAKKLISSGSARKCEADLNNAYNEYEKTLNDLESHIKDMQSGKETHTKYGPISDQWVDLTTKETHARVASKKFEKAYIKRNKNKNMQVYDTSKIDLLNKKASELSKLTSDLIYGSQKYVYDFGEYLNRIIHNNDNDN